MTAPGAPAPPLDGECDARFAAVREAMRENLAEGTEIGGAVCVRIDGRCVVDLWGGYRDAARTQAWRRDTLVNAYSVGKGILAILAAICVEEGLLDLDVPVASIWPEFAAGGKQAVGVDTLLAHRAGLPAVRRRLPEAAFGDWSAMCAALAEQRPYWDPDTAHGYHVNTYGFLVGELIRRVTGLAVGDALARRVCGPLGADFHYGLPRTEHPRVAETVAPDVTLRSREEWARAFPPTGDPEHDEMIWHAYFNPAGLSGFGSVNTEAWRLAQVPSTGGHGTARAVAAIYAAFLAGGPPGRGWAGDEVQARFRAVRSDGPDRVLGRESRFGLGFQLAHPDRAIGRSPRAFGHFGYGGSLGFADPDAGVAFGYLMNHPGERWQSDRTRRLVDALYQAL